jgi:hypothetical protein
MSTPTSVYRYYDGDGALVYVGITARGVQRQNEHNAHAEWWPFVVRQEVEHYPSRDDAAARERELIQRFGPPFNKQHNEGYEALKARYLAEVGPRVATGSCTMQVDCDDDQCDAFAEWQTGWCGSKDCQSCHRAHHNYTEAWDEAVEYTVNNVYRTSIVRLCAHDDAQVAAAAYALRAAAERLASLIKAGQVQTFMPNFDRELNQIMPTDEQIEERLITQRRLAEGADAWAADGVPF